MSGEHTPGRAERERRLTAAAPDMFDALVLAEDMLDDVVGSEEHCTDEPLLKAWRACKAAIAKAKAQPQGGQ